MISPSITIFLCRKYPVASELILLDISQHISPTIIKATYSPPSEPPWDLYVTHWASWQWFIERVKLKEANSFCPPRGTMILTYLLGGSLKASLYG